MKLRNKNTGEVFDALIREKGGAGSYSLIVCDVKSYEQSKSTLDATHFVLDEYETLTELNEDWEDYKPAEPLIKDAGAREVVRLWAKVNRIPTNATTIEYHFVESLCGTESEFWDNNLHIMFYGKIAPNAVHGKIYTIDELCGEEEE